MTASEPATITAPGIEEAVRKKLQEAPNPLKLSEVVKGFPKLKKPKKGPPPPDLNEEARKILDEEVRLGRAFSYPSGKNGESRYWAKDEKHLLREKTLEFAHTPQSIPALKKQVAAVVKGTDGAFGETVIREMIADDVLFEHPEQKKGTPLFGAEPPPPPPPPLEQPKHKKALDKLVGDCGKLLTAAGVSAGDLLQVLSERLCPVMLASPAVAEPHTTNGSQQPSASDEIPSDLKLEELILQAAATRPVVSLADLRREMPGQYQGKVFDATVLALASKERVIISQDTDPARLSAAERAEFVSVDDVVFTTLMSRG